MKISLLRTIHPFIHEGTGIQTIKNKNLNIHDDIGTLLLPYGTIPIESMIDILNSLVG